MYLEIPMCCVLWIFCRYCVPNDSSVSSCVKFEYCESINYYLFVLSTCLVFVIGCLLCFVKPKVLHLFY